MMQAKDIAERPILELLATLPPNSTANRYEETEPGRAYRSLTVRTAMPAETPGKVVLAKMRTLIKRGLVGGCACGCRGDFHLTAKGRAALDASPPHP
jgi:hypothetical protein